MKLRLATISLLSGLFAVGCSSSESAPDTSPGGSPGTGGAGVEQGSGGAASNGALSTGGAGSPEGTTGGSGTAGASGSNSPGCGVPTGFKWTSSPALISPPTGSVSIKDPSVVFYDGKWHVYATEYSGGYNMTYLNFTDWDQAATATPYLMDQTPGFSGYRCAPQIFYFEPHKKWYLIYQQQAPAYSTTSDLSDPKSWTAPKTLIATEPEIVTQNKGEGTWIDYWVICDDTNCHLFFSDDNGHLYRSQTAKTSFPEGFGTPVIVMSGAKFDLFEAANVYKIKGSNKYLMIVEAIGNGRYFRSWTADTLDGTWTPLADTQGNPFAGKNNVTGASWSNDGISHGEMLRDGYDETLTIDTCNMKYLFQGRTAEGTSYDLHEYSLGLLTPAP